MLLSKIVRLALLNLHCQLEKFAIERSIFFSFSTGDLSIIASDDKDKYSWWCFVIFAWFESIIGHFVLLTFLCYALIIISHQLLSGGPWPSLTDKRNLTLHWLMHKKPYIDQNIIQLVITNYIINCNDQVVIVLVVV